MPPKTYIFTRPVGPDRNIQKRNARRGSPAIEAIAEGAALAIRLQCAPSDMPALAVAASGRKRITRLGETAKDSGYNFNRRGRMLRAGGPAHSFVHPNIAISPEPILSAPRYDDLVDRIYEAAIIPELWPSTLAELTAIGEGAFATLLVVHDQTLRWVGTPAASALVSDYVALGRPDLNTRISRIMNAERRPGFWTDLDIFAEHEIHQEPFYRDFMHPRGYGWVAATAVGIPTGETLSVSVERHYKRGPFERRIVDQLDLFGPHLSRAGLFAARLGLERAFAMTDALSGVGLPAAVLRHNNRPLAMNALFEALMPDVVCDRNERLSLVASGPDALFARALEQLRYGEEQGAVSSIPIAADAHRPPLIVHVLPVCRSAHDIFMRAATIVVMTPVIPSKTPNVDVLQGLFDLTPAEARVARGVGSGDSVDDIANALSLSRETVRSQLKAVLAKTGVNRQAELVSLLAGQDRPTVAVR